MLLKQYTSGDCGFLDEASSQFFGVNLKQLGHQLHLAGIGDRGAFICSTEANVTDVQNRGQAVKKTILVL